MRMHKTIQIIRPAARGLAKLAVSVWVALLVGQALASDSRAQAGASPAELWQPVEVASSVFGPKRLQVAALYKTMRLNQSTLAELLARAPMEFTEAVRTTPAIITLPMPDGTLARFSFEESPIIEAGLAAQFPELKTYRAQGIDDPTATARFDWLPSGFHAMVLASSGTVLIDPQNSSAGNAISASSAANYTSYFKRDAVRTSEPFTCGVVGDVGSERMKRPADHLSTESAGKRVNLAAISGVTLRTYRLAVAATNEYAVAVGGNTVAGTLAAQVVVMNRVNGIYERDLAIRMVIVNNNNLLLYAGDNLTCGGACTAANDPYTNNSGNTMLTENQAKVDALIGTANYDIGHVFSTGGGGVASLQSPCDGARKAQGVTGLPDPSGDAFAVDLVAHELGHQWGANHTFNGALGQCKPANRNQVTAYEVGSGISIMGYPSTCETQNLAGQGIDTFNVKSLEEMLDFRDNGGGSSCGVPTTLTNSLPVVTGPGNFTIPKGTPFALKATATDASTSPVDALSYDWQEYDLDVGLTGNGTIAVPNSDADGVARPIFRSYLPSANGTRLFPSLAYILNNANVPPATYIGADSQTYLTGELLPAISRVMNFQVVVRDNRSGGGGLVTATSAVTIDSASGPFVVTAPNTAVNVVGGSSLNVTWNVAGTSAAPVSAANVKVSLSTDGGNTFPTVLAASAPNNGSTTVTLPNTATTTARIKVEAVGNIFFDISDANFTVTAGAAAAAGPLDVDASDTATRYDAATDGVLIVRYMLGFTGTALTDNALGATGTRRDPVALKTYLDGIRLASLDVDGDTKVDALTDGLLILRYMLGIKGAALVAGAVNPAGSRTTSTAVETFLGVLTP